MFGIGQNQTQKEQGSNDFSAPKTPTKQRKAKPKISKHFKKNTASAITKLPRSNSIPDLERQSMIENPDEIEATAAKKHTVNFLEPMHDVTKQLPGRERKLT